MPLPKLETPKYSLVVPSTGKKIEFRPFLVKEEKILMIAQESGNSDDMVRAICSIIDACTFGSIDIRNLASYDLEYIFLQLRGKSVGETSEFKLSCSHCNAPNKVTLDISTVSVKKKDIKVENTIMVSDDVGLTLSPIRVKDLSKMSGEGITITDTIKESILNIFDGDSVYDINEADPKELDEFVDSLSHASLEKIKDFFENQPSLEHDLEFVCSSCGEKNELLLKGLESFFQ